MLQGIQKLFGPLLRKCPVKEVMELQVEPCM
jgi:hypothetical protein